MKIKTTSSKVRNAGYLAKVEGAANAWFDGGVATAHGFVIASSYGEFLSLRLIWRGRLYHRRIERPAYPGPPRASCGRPRNSRRRSREVRSDRPMQRLAAGGN